jgi:hypothetical protein
MVSPQAKREAVTTLMVEQDFGVTRACGLLCISRSLLSISQLSGRLQQTACADRGDRIAEASVWLSAGARSAAPGGLADQPQAHLSAV